MRNPGLTDRQLSRVVERLVAYLYGSPGADLDSEDVCRQLSELLLREMPPATGESVRRSPAGHREEIEAALRLRAEHEPPIRALVRKLLEDGPNPASRPLVYEDLTLRFGLPRGPGYPVSIQSPAGNGSGQLEIPPDIEWPVSSGALRDVGPAPGHRQGGTLLQDTGDRLFRALFKDRVLNLFERSLGMFQGREDQGLRIRIQLDLEHPEMLRLNALPWEWLYRKDRREFPALVRRRPVVRGLDVPHPERPAVAGPVRLLLAMSSPSGYPPLDLEKERSLIEEALQRAPRIELIPLEHATPESLWRRCREEEPHIIHFMGHGSFDRETGHGALLLEDQWGGPRPLSGEVLGDILREHQSLRLAVLNACRTGESAREAGWDPFSGVAAALVMAGLPAVLAMSAPVPDSAAVAFSAAFYRGLTAGDPVEAATTEGRKAIRCLQDQRSPDWSIPILFLRQHGDLFSPQSP